MHGTGRRSITALVLAGLGASLLVALPIAASATAPAPIGPETLVAGGWGVGGPATQARFGGRPPVPAALPDGRIAWAEADGSAVHVRNTDGTVSCLAGCSHTAGFSGDGGPAVDAQLNWPTGLAAAPDGSLYVSDNGNDRLRRIAPDGTITTVVGTGSAATWTDSGAATTVDIVPWAVTVGADGTVYVVDTAVRPVVRKLVGNSLTTAVGGAINPSSSWDDSWNGKPATSVTLDWDTYSYGIAVAPDKALLITTGLGRRVLRAPLDGTIASIAGVGNGVGENLGDGGPATAATLAGPTSIVAEADGSLDVASGDAIRHFTVGGTISTRVSGLLGLQGLQLRSGAFLSVGTLAAEPDGNASVVIRSTTSAGATTTLVGGSRARVGDGQTLSDAWFPNVTDTLTLDDGTLVVAEASGVVRVAGPDRVVRTVAGSSLGAVDFTGEGGPATSAVLPHPRALARDAVGDLFIACGDGAVRELLASDGTIHTVLGTGTRWVSTPPVGPLPGTSMPLSAVRSLSVGPDGALYVLDGDGSSAYRLVRLAAGSASQITGTEAALTGVAALGRGLGALAGLEAFGFDADGTAVAVAGNDLYRTSPAGTIMSVEGIFAGPLSVVRPAATGVLVAGSSEVVRLNADGSRDWFSGTSVGASWSIGAGLLTWDLPGSGLFQRTLPDAVVRPAAPAAVLGTDADGIWPALRVGALAPGMQLEVFAYPGAAQTRAPRDATYLSAMADPGTVPITNVAGASVGDTITLLARLVDPVGHTTSVPAQLTVVWRLPHQCVQGPSSRLVAYGATFTAVATVKRGGVASPSIAGTWTYAPGGLTALRYAATATAASGTTAKAFKILRTTTITYTATTAGAVAGCASRTIYSVRAILKAVPSVTSARRGAYVRITGLLTPRVARQYVTLQRLVGTRWYSLVRGLTTSTGAVVFSTRLPSSAGYAYYRVVSATSTALVAGVSPAVRIRAT